MSKPPKRDDTREIKIVHEVRRAAFFKKWANVVKMMKRGLDELRAGKLAEDARNALFFEVNRLAGSLETLGWYREAELAVEIKDKLQPGRAISSRDLARIDFLVAELERVANC